MEPPASLAALLRAYLQRTGYTADRLAKESTVPKPTIVNWLEGRAKKPRDYLPLLLVAAALHLDEHEATALLQAAGHPPLDRLRSNIQDMVQKRTGRERTLLERWLVSDEERVRQAQRHVAALCADTVPAPGSLPRGSRIVLQRNPLFVGREADLQALARALATSTTVAIAATTGMGGIGKTQLAAEFVHRYGPYFDGGVFWLSFADPAAVPAQIAACGGADGMALRPNWPNVSFDEQVRLVQAAWHSPLPRLLVFDNCEHEALVAQWRPATGGCRVLVTSRRAQWNPLLGVEALPLDVLPRADSVRLLRKHRPDVVQDAHLHALAEEVGDLPLALQVAGRYLARYRYAVSPPTYVEQLRRATVHTLSREVGQDSPTAHVQRLDRTVALSYRRLDPAAPIDALALALLARAACFAPGEPIGRNLLVTTLQRSDLDGLHTEDALGRLLNLGLVEPATHGAVRMHRLVIAVVQHQQTDDTAQAAVEQTLIDLMNRYNEASDVTTLVAVQTHLRFVTERAAIRNDARAANLCEQLAYHLWLIGHPAEAQTYLERALTIYKQAPQPDLLAMASVYNLLALSLQMHNQFEQAQKIFEQALAIWEPLLGPEHERTITEWNNLGYLLQALGEYDQAAHYLEQSLRARHRLFGLYHVDTARSIHNVAYLSFRQGNYRRAERHLKLALRIRTCILPPIHVSTGLTLNCLGEVAYKQAQYEQAWEYHHRALNMRIALFGEQHFDPGESYYNLGRVLHAWNRLEEARSYLERAIAINRTMQDATYYSTATMLCALGAVLRDQGQMERAQACLEEAITTWERRRGSAYVDLVIPLNDLGLLFQQQGDLAGAQTQFERALRICSEKLGDVHPDTAMTLNNLGRLHQAQGNTDDARICFQKALAICQQRLAPEHPLTRSIRDSLAALSS